MVDKTDFIGTVAGKLQELVEQGQPLRDDFEKNVRAILANAFSKMDLLTREEFDAQVAEPHRQSIGDARGVVLDLPVVTEGRLRTFERRHRGVAADRGMVRQDLIHEGVAPRHSLGRKAPFRALGFIGVVVDDRVPEIERNPTNGHQLFVSSPVSPWGYPPSVSDGVASRTPAIVTAKCSV